MSKVINHHFLIQILLCKQQLTLNSSYVVCREVIPSTNSLAPSAVCFSSFENGEINCHVWEAGRATSAAPTFFAPATIAGCPRQFVDGGLGYNNPIWTFTKQREFVPGINDRPECYVSIGTGKPTERDVQGVRKWWRPDGLKGISYLKEVATDSESSSETFEIYIDAL